MREFEANLVKRTKSLNNNQHNHYYYRIYHSGNINYTRQIHKQQQPSSRLVFISKFLITFD